jgi:oxygen-independent coproporphyrinogen-3 oxidase
VQRYSDRRVLVTGGGSGIGQACVLRILAEGGMVAAADISEAGLSDTRAKAGVAASELSTVIMDVGDEASVKAGVRQAVEGLGGLDTLVNVAGILRSAHFAETSLADFEQVLRVNLVGTFLVTREALPALRQGRAPAVVNFSSTSADFAHPYMSAYAASKGALTTMTKSLARALAPKIRVNAICPGFIDTPWFEKAGMSAERLAAVLDAVRDHFPLAADAEITTEANPESTSPEFFAGIRAAGYTRVSLGMQSSSARVLAVLDRTHSPGRAIAAAHEAAAAGFGHVNIDLIYGTPGESDDDLLASVDAALAAGVDHISAYALVVEAGTALARRVRRGELPRPDDDVMARRYELIDRRLSAAGLQWYEVSNWSRPGGECRHNLGYWNGGQWWGAGPGAHGFVGDIRWWNIKHPGAYAEQINRGAIAVTGFEHLDAHTRHIEEVMLGIRLGSGLAVAALTDSEADRAARAVAEGTLSSCGERLRLTDRGRLLADAVVRDLLDD